MGWSTCFRSICFCFWPDFLHQKFSTLPTESFLRVLTVRNRKRRLPSQLLTFNCPSSRAQVWKQKGPKREFRRELEGWGYSMGEPGGKQWAYPSCPPNPPCGQPSSQEPDRTSSQVKKAEQRKEGEAHRVKVGERASIAGNPSCNACANMSRLRSECIGAGMLPALPPMASNWSSWLWTHSPLIHPSTEQIWYHSSFKDHSLHWRWSPNCSTWNLRLIMSPSTRSSGHSPRHSIPWTGYHTFVCMLFPLNTMSS